MCNNNININNDRNNNNTQTMLITVDELQIVLYKLPIGSSGFLVTAISCGPANFTNSREIQFQILDLHSWELMQTVYYVYKQPKRR